MPDRLVLVPGRQHPDIPLRVPPAAPRLQRVPRLPPPHLQPGARFNKNMFGLA